MFVLKKLSIAASILAFAAPLAHATVDSNTHDDAKVKADVQAILNQHPELGPPNAIHVQSSDHVVYLYGIVDTGADQWLAESLAAQTPGVNEVVNSIAQRN